MKAKILLLLLLSSLIIGCRSKHKITTINKENRTETETVKIDSLNLHHSKSIQKESADESLKEENNEISGDLLITGTSDASNPFVFHNVVGKDTIQRISIRGNAEYTISNYYTKADHKKSETRREESSQSIQDENQKTISKNIHKEVASKTSEESKKVKLNGFDAAAWVFITLIGIVLIIVFFTYKYFKK